MVTNVVFIALALSGFQSDKAVTDAEKKEFFALLAKLPTRGEFFTDESVTKTVPYTRVLLALTEIDVKGRDLYAFLALSRGLVDRKEARQYGITHFKSIAHPMIKLAWATQLVSDTPAPPEIVNFLRVALDSKEQSQILAAYLGPGFEEFKDQVLRAYEQARHTRVELTRRRTIDAFPPDKNKFPYLKECCVFAPDQRLHVCRPLEQQGELITYDLAAGSTSRRPIPQPNGFKAEFDFETYFTDPALWVNSRGDLLCRWTIRGNGDHGLALLKKGADSFRVTPVTLALADSFVVPGPEGSWYLIRGAPRFAIYRVEGDLKLTHLGEFAGLGHHSKVSCDHCRESHCRLLYHR